MIKIIKNGEVFAPDYLGKKDIIITANKIGYIVDKANFDSGNLKCQTIDARNNYIVPGFIDNHQHITGGGGEGGFKTRTPEISLNDIISGGITSIIGCLGTDGTTRNLASLLAKARALEEEGISSYIYTGSYQLPPRTITGNIRDDIILIEKVLGVAEIAISDHRSSQPTIEEVKRIIAEARVGGMLSAKAGLVVFHVGDGEGQIDYLETIIENTEIPYKQILPTHMNRNINLLKKAIEYAKKGGFVDFTTSGNSDLSENDPTRCSNSLKKLLDNGVPVENITFSSDAQGSLPVFDKEGEFKGLKVGKATSLYQQVREAVLRENVNLEDALKVITSNPADMFLLKSKGRIKCGHDADIVLLNKEDLKVETVIAGGKLMVYKNRPMVKGTFAI